MSEPQPELDMDGTHTTQPAQPADKTQPKTESAPKTEQHDEPLGVEPLEERIAPRVPSGDR